MEEVAKLEQFVHAMEKMRSGLYIVTSAYRAQLAGCTCVWVTRSSFIPPLVSVCLAPGRYTLGIVEQGKRFCVNVLGEGSRELARRFGFTSGLKVKKFEGVAYHRGAGGSPILDEALSYLDCRLSAVFPVGDHRLVVGELVDAAVQHEGVPMIYDPETFYNDEAERLRATQAT
jgi:flavin reductase (DIM6/NTAB) family NADH-FMN oxidoreductase RutF